MTETLRIRADKYMSEDEMCDVAEANIRADYREGVIDRERFRMEMLIVARSRPKRSTK